MHTVIIGVSLVVALYKPKGHHSLLSLKIWKTIFCYRSYQRRQIAIYPAIQRLCRLSQ